MEEAPVSDDLVCPINLELLFDPVVAEDGRLYERTAIVTHFENRQSAGEMIKSPMTNEPMGNRLTTAYAIKNHIQTLVEHEIITGELATKWKTTQKEVSQKKEMEKMIKKADEGDIEAMELVFENFWDGQHGFPKDDVASLRWVERAFDAGSPYATTVLGVRVLLKDGDGSNVPMGMLYLGIAAAKGSDCGAFWLGMALASDELFSSCPKDLVEAKKWLELSISDNCAYKNMSEDAKGIAQTELDVVRKKLEKKNSGA